VAAAQLGPVTAAARGADRDALAGLERTSAVARAERDGAIGQSVARPAATPRRPQIVTH
jgi:hypothetical protein